ncbi:hypothetical protein GCM10010124_08440 [Pilimelia terevasa]|uniref:Flagellar FliJ protein n=1 Tax=Pilimelia terevasa TaxID=53372 RepID=A0A8J3BLQ0_9ACTN|nr:cell envelope biogenesis protein TolA [Pilimelia terevasa]GGK18138.1 hypothetical protein GCM10010124_08440 [Pilimelia terevasa]
MGTFKLSAVLRARQAQEDVRKAEVVRARGASRAARERADERKELLRGSEALVGGTGRAVVAAIAARQALAAGLAAAHRGVEEADLEIAESTDRLADAAKNRRIVERLGERHAAAAKSKHASAEQRALDEIAITGATRGDRGAM